MRHGFKHGRNGNPIKYAVAGVIVILAVIVWLAPSSKPLSKSAPQATSDKASQQSTPVANTDKTSTAAILEVAKVRCVMCHGAALQSKNIRVDSIEALDKNAALVYQQVVVTKLMPMNNSTGVTAEEREQIAAWFKAKK